MLFTNSFTFFKLPRLVLSPGILRRWLLFFCKILVEIFRTPRIVESFNHLNATFLTLRNHCRFLFLFGAMFELPSIWFFFSFQTFVDIIAKLKSANQVWTRTEFIKWRVSDLFLEYCHLSCCHLLELIFSDTILWFHSLHITIIDSIADIVTVISVYMVDNIVTVLIKLWLVEFKPMVVVAHVCKHLSWLQKGEFMVGFTVCTGKWLLFWMRFWFGRSTWGLEELVEVSVWCCHYYEIRFQLVEDVVEKFLLLINVNVFNYLN